MKNRKILQIQTRLALVFNVEFDGILTYISNRRYKVSISSKGMFSVKDFWKIFRITCPNHGCRQLFQTSDNLQRRKFWNAANQHVNMIFVCFHNLNWKVWRRSYWKQNILHGLFNISLEKLFAILTYKDDVIFDKKLGMIFWNIFSLNIRHAIILMYVKSLQIQNLSLWRTEDSFCKDIRLLQGCLQLGIGCQEEAVGRG